jgi:D-glycero-alpha-D-manno-heptose-7-phosphate kinase
MDILKEPSGKQDPYIASFGNFFCLDINRDGVVNTKQLKIHTEVARELENNLLFFYTGFRRDSSEVLKNQKSAMEKDFSSLEAMHNIKEIGMKVQVALKRGDLTEFGRLQHEHWLAKKSITEKMSNPLIDKWYTQGIKNGAIGGKIMGAGGGGFLMFYCENGRNKVRKIMTEEGLREVRFHLGVEGTKIILNM